MKYSLITLVFSFAAAVSLSQNKIPPFGEVDKADFALKDCVFDKGAEAVKLIDWGTMYYDRGTSGITQFKTVYERRVRIKILNEKGLGYANVSIPYRSFNNDEVILKMEANSYNLDESGKIIVTPLSKESFYNKKIDRYYSRMSFAFPAVKAGSIIEYRYKLERESMGQVKAWYFQDMIPTVYSEYFIKIPSALVFDIQPIINVADAIEVKITDSKDLINTGNGDLVEVTMTNKDFILRNQPGIRKYAYMGAVSDYLQRLEFQLKQIDYGDGRVRDLRTTWADVVKELADDEDFGKLLNLPLDELTPVINEAKKLSSQNEKIQFLLKYFRTEFSWNEDEGIYAHNGWRKLWTNKKGNTGDINLAFINALNQAGIKALPLLVSSRDNGLVNSSFPFTSQFNKILAYIPDNSNYLVINAADRFQIPNLVPPDVVNTRAFMVNEPSGKIVDLIDNSHLYKVFIANKAVISADGNVTGESIVNFSDYAKQEATARLKDNRAWYIQSEFAAPNKDVKIDTLSIKNTELNLQVMEHSIKFSAPANTSGNYTYFNISMFSGFGKNPFIEETRHADVDFGYSQQYILFGNFIIPDGYEFDELPKDVLIQIPDGSAAMSCNYAADGNMLNTRFEINFKRSFYETDVYPEFKAFYKQMLDKLNEQVVIKKKN